MNCRVCGTKLPHEYTTCPYCGYGNPAILTLDSDNSPEYRGNLLKSIRNITVEADLYRYSEEEQGFIELDEERFLFDKPLDGADCYEKIVRSDSYMAHFEGSTDLVILYQIGDSELELTVPVRFEACEGLWYLGLSINPELQLQVFWCVEPVPNDGQAPRWLSLEAVKLTLLPPNKA